MYELHLREKSGNETWILLLSIALLYGIVLLRFIATDSSPAFHYTLLLRMPN